LDVSSTISVGVGIVSVYREQMSAVGPFQKLTLTRQLSGIWYKADERR